VLLARRLGLLVDSPISTLDIRESRKGYNYMEIFETLPLGVSCLSWRLLLVRHDRHFL
jgi:hypothetical protein